MCGIAGAVSPSLAARGELRAVVEEMCRRLRHRGPDGRGVHVEGDAALGAARLAVIDPRPIAQPLVSADGRHVIAYNGEVYNQRELRRQLESRGATFLTDTDTEVVLEAVKAWGTDALPRLHGMFAFVVLDRVSGELVGGRDRLGQKPLFLLEDGETFAFSSFLPSLHALPGFAPRLDPLAVHDVVELGYVLSPKTPFQEVRQLPPAHGFTWTAGRLQTFAYWDLAAAFVDGRCEDAGSERAAAERFDAALAEAVGDRLVADVPLGALVSGGLDSSIVAALMVSRSTERVRTFALGFDEPGFDERAHARALATHLGTEHREDRVHLDLAASLAWAQWHVGEPLADTSVLPTALVSEMARRHVTVVLTGDGADELFAGYETYRADRVRAALASPAGRPLRPLVRLLARALPADHGKVSLAYKVRRFASGQDLPAAEAHYHWRALQDRDDALACLLPDARAAVSGYEPVERFRQLDAEVSPCDAVNRASYVDLRTYLLDDILVKVDRCAMACSLEARNPFLDHRVVEAAAALPGRMKLRGLETKWLLRRQHAHRLPAATLRRKKEGFSAPVSRWLLGPARDLFEEVARPERLEPLGLDAAAARRLHASLEQGRGFHGYVLWAILTLGLWNELRTLPDAPARPEPVPA